MNSYVEGIQYAEDVCGGKIVAGIHIRAACRNFLDDMSNPKWDFKPDAVDAKLRFLNILRHSSKDYNNQPFILLPFQVWIVCALFGFYHAGTNRRKHRRAYLQLSRKTGKSFFIIALAYSVLMEKGASFTNIAITAGSRKDAMDIDFPLMEGFALKLDPKQKYIKRYRDQIKTPSTQGRIYIVPKDPTDGGLITMGIVDEFHQAVSSDAIDMITGSQHSLENALTLIITSAGYNRDTKICWEYRNYGVEVLNKIKEDDTVFNAIYELDETDDWQDENVWMKAIPSLGENIDIQTIREVYNTAVNNPIELKKFKTKFLNMWLKDSGGEKWIPDKVLKKAMLKDLKISDFYNKGYEAVLGLDLSTSGDLTSLAIMIKDHDGKHFLFNKNYMPSCTVDVSSLKNMFSRWQELGELTIFEDSNICDYDMIVRDIEEINKLIPIRKIYYDSWNSSQMVVQLVKLGYDTSPYSMSNFSMNAALTGYFKLINDGYLFMPDSKALKFQFPCIEVVQDYRGNVMIKKDNYRKKRIDSVMAQVIAIGGQLQTEREEAGIPEFDAFTI